MNPITAAMIFVVFWAIAGLGLFLMANSLVSLSRQGGSPGTVVQAISTGATSVRVQAMVNLGLFIAGAVLTWLGVTSIYNVVYR